MVYGATLLRENSASDVNFFFVYATANDVAKLNPVRSVT